MFLYWKENERRIDVDLSATAYDNDWKYKTHLDWTSLQSLGCKHSGDIQSAPNGASEFIDLNLKSLRKAGIRYIVMNVFSFSGQKYSTFQSFAGFMEREDANKGEIFEAKTVKNKFDLTSESTVCLPMFFDIEEGKAFVYDIAFSSNRHMSVSSSVERISGVCQAVQKMSAYKLSFKDLFTLHAQSCGANIDFIKKEGVKYDLEITPDFALKNINEVLANWI